MLRRAAVSTLALLVALTSALGGCARKPPVDPPRATCVLGQSAVDQCVVR